MTRKLQIKRGKKANMPTLAEGELGFATDEKSIYIGTGTENVPVAAPLDNTMSDASENGVKNKAIKTYVDSQDNEIMSLVSDLESEGKLTFKLILEEADSNDVVDLGMPRSENVKQGSATYGLDPGLYQYSYDISGSNEPFLSFLGTPRPDIATKSFLLYVNFTEFGTLNQIIHFFDGKIYTRDYLLEDDDWMPWEEVGNSTFKITLSGKGNDLNPYVVDKTITEIEKAYNDGKIIYLWYDGSFFYLQQFSPSGRWADFTNACGYNIFTYRVGDDSILFENEELVSKLYVDNLMMVDTATEV